MTVAPTLVLFHIIKLDILRCFRTTDSKDNPTLSHKELVRYNFHQRFPKKADLLYDGFWIRVHKGYEILREQWDILMNNAKYHFQCAGPTKVDNEGEDEDDIEGTLIVQPHKLNKFKVMKKAIRATLIMVHNEWRAHPDAETKDVRSEIIPTAMAKYRHYKHNGERQEFVEAHKQSEEDACYKKFLIHQATHPNTEERMEESIRREIAEFAETLKQHKQENKTYMRWYLRNLKLTPTPKDQKTHPPENQNTQPSENQIDAETLTPKDQETQPPEDQETLPPEILMKAKLRCSEMTTNLQNDWRKRKQRKSKVARIIEIRKQMKLEIQWDKDYLTLLKQQQSGQQMPDLCPALLMAAERHQKKST
jgi:hypothetical protein